MTANEMDFEFLLNFDKVASSGAPGYTEAERSSFLSIAQERYIKTHYHSLGNKYKKGFEHTEKRRTDLKELIRDYQVLTPSSDQDGINKNGTFYDLPEDYMWAIEEDIVTDVVECGESGISRPLTGFDLNDYLYAVRIPVKPISHDEFIANKHNPFKKPYCDNLQGEGLCWRLDFSREDLFTNPQRHELITNGVFGITGYHMRYIRKPNDIVIDNTSPYTNMVNCELSDSTHREIIDIAVGIALENIQDPRFQTQALETNNNE